jgi:hypothetical protein
MESLRQRCPTLSPFATLGDRRFQGDDRKVFRNKSLIIKTQHFPNFFYKSGDNKAFVDIIVAIERIWLYD